MKRGVNRKIIDAIGRKPDHAPDQPAEGPAMAAGQSVPWRPLLAWAAERGVSRDDFRQSQILAGRRTTWAGTGYISPRWSYPDARRRVGELEETFRGMMASGSTELMARGRIGDARAPERLDGLFSSEEWSHWVRIVWDTGELHLARPGREIHAFRIEVTTAAALAAYEAALVEARSVPKPVLSRSPPDPLAASRRRGRKETVTPKIVLRMLADIEAGNTTIEELEIAKLDALATKYGCSRTPLEGALKRVRAAIKSRCFS
jgi:hypothetical protein